MSDAELSRGGSRVNAASRIIAQTRTALRPAPLRRVPPAAPPTEQVLPGPAERLRRQTRQHGFAVLAVVYLATVTAAEVVTALFDARLGMLLHIFLLCAVLLHAALERDERRYGFLLALSLMPMIRILSLSLPLKDIQLKYWYVIVAVPLVVSALVVVRQLSLNWREIGFQIGPSWRAQLLIACTGFGLSLIEYAVLRPQPLIPRFSWGAFVVPALILLIGTGCTEEFIFRGVLLSTSRKVLGKFSLLYVTAMFAILHVGYKSLTDLLFVFAVGALYAWCTWYTGSILGTSLSHGISNIGLYLVVPFLSIAGVTSVPPAAAPVPAQATQVVVRATPRPTATTAASDVPRAPATPVPSASPVPTAGMLTDDRILRPGAVLAKRVDVSLDGSPAGNVVVASHVASASGCDRWFLDVYAYDPTAGRFVDRFDATTGDVPLLPQPGKTDQGCFPSVQLLEARTFSGISTPLVIATVVQADGRRRLVALGIDGWAGKVKLAYDTQVSAGASIQVLDGPPRVEISEQAMAPAIPGLTDVGTAPIGTLQQVLGGRAGSLVLLTQTLTPTCTTGIASAQQEIAGERWLRLICPSDSSAGRALFVLANDADVQPPGASFDTIQPGDDLVVTVDNRLRQPTTATNAVPIASAVRLQGAAVARVAASLSPSPQALPTSLATPEAVPSVMRDPFEAPTIVTAAPRSVAPVNAPVAVTRPPATRAPDVVAPAAAVSVPTRAPAPAPAPAPVSVPAPVAPRPLAPANPIPAAPQPTQVPAVPVGGLAPAPAHVDSAPAPGGLAPVPSVPAPSGGLAPPPSGR